ncbi:Uu.00g096810.m01.CDS01 [Anthostomella pinea]|uniref:Small ribosomal subunit protein bS18m n=1 Tax=Anthostomella pinea TaxID=933095 RepID=A0AAI8VD02_9PEZI|nr:Uu.00g096810.m01.CDS01 [Anthostomella pinea]
MPPRIPLLSALRQQASAFVKAPCAPLSSTASSQAIRTDSATASLLNIDSPSPSSSGKPSPNNSDPTRAASDIYKSIGNNRGSGPRGTPESRQRLEQDLRAKNQTEDYARQMTRRWRVGDVYAPHDISPSEMGKWRRNQARKQDLVDMLGLSPLDMYRNFSVISEFMTPHGRIKRSVDTGLRPPNQRKMAKAIRRAIGLGIHPSVHKHPELLMREADRTYQQNQATTNKALKWS